MTRSSGKRWLRTLALFLLLLAAARFTDCSPTLFWARRSHLTDLISAMLPPDWGYAPRILAPAAGYGADVRHPARRWDRFWRCCWPPCARKISMPLSRSGGRCGCWCRCSAPSLR